MAKKLRVALWHNMVTHYSIPLFQWVTANTDIDLHVLYGEERPHFRSWKVDFGEGYSYEVLPHYRIPRVEYVLNPTLPSVLTKGGYDVVMATDANEFGAQSAFRTARRLDIPFALWTKEIDYVDADPFWSFRDVVAFIPRQMKKLMLMRSQHLSNRLKRESDSYLAFSERARDHIVSRGGDQRRIVRINNTIDLGKFQTKISKAMENGAAEALKQEHGWENKKIILSLAYLKRRKGIHILLEAFARLQRNDTILAIVGNGPFKQDLMRMAEQKKIPNVYFLPNTSTPEVFYLASAVSVLVTVGCEPWGLTVNEALLAGCPVIVSENVGAGTILPDRRMVVPTGDVDSLTETLQLFLDDEQLRRSFAAKGRETILHECSVDQAGKGLVTALRMAAQA